MIRYAQSGDAELLLQYDKHIAESELKNKIALKQIIMMFDGNDFIGWLRYNLFWDNTPFMNMLYILDGYRGQGSGGMLTEFWEADMRAQGYKMVMTSSQANEQGQFFYRKHGYIDCGSLLLPGEPLEIIFMKEL